MIKQKIIDFCGSMGLDTIGFCPCRKFEELKPFYEMRLRRHLQNEFEAKELEERINPFMYMPEGRTIISLAFPYYVKEQEEKENGFSIYTKRQDYHRVVKQYLNELISFIESLGGKAVGMVDSNALPERYIAYLAGVGFIGKNNMLITEKYGSYVFLGEIITDLEIKCIEERHYEDLKQYKECGSCEKCLGECPTRSINKAGCNPNICLSYLTQKKDLTDGEIKLLKGNIFGCDFCQLKCPYNENAESSGLSGFKALDYMNDEPAFYAGMDNKFFKEKMSSTSCGWRGKNVIKRNALIRMAYEEEEIEGLAGESPYLNDYIKRLLEIKRKRCYKNGKMSK